MLETNALTHGTVHANDKLIRSIKPSMLTLNDRTRLQIVVLHVVDTRDGRAFRAYCRLARQVDGPTLRENLARRGTGAEANVRRQALGSGGTGTAGQSRRERDWNQQA